MPEFLQPLAPVWYWLCLGVFLLVLELLTGSAFFLCISTATFVLAAVTYTVPTLPWLWGLTLFACLMPPTAAFWWRCVRRRKTRTPEAFLNERDKTTLGAIVTLTEDSVNGKGQLRIADSTWPYTCDRPLTKGMVVRVTGVDGIILRVEVREENAM